MVRSMMSYSTMPTTFWGYALLTACYLLNNIPSKSVPKTPHKLWTGKITPLNHIRIWGCPAHVLDKESTKLDSRSEVCMFVGYPRETKGGYFYNPMEDKVFVSMNVTFLEDSYVQDFKSRSKVMLEDMSNNIVASGVPNMDSYPINEERQTEQQIPRELRRTGRIVRQPDRFMSNGKAIEVEAIGHDDDAYNYNEAMGDVDANLGTCRLTQRDKTHRMQVGL